MDNASFSQILEQDGRVSEQEIALLGTYRGIVEHESAVQNLTTKILPKDFYETHILDCIEFRAWGALKCPAMDLGSGLGVPGIPSAIFGVGPWVLAESEGRKADFLKRATTHLGLEATVRVYPGRAEAYLKSSQVSTVVARAVGPVGRIYGWIQGCSTWNSLVLFKGRGWDDEWAADASSSAQKNLKVVATHEYEVGDERKKRCIILLERI